MNTDVMFSSKSDDWETPPEFFRQLDDIFHFTIDLAANEENALCKKFYTYEDNQSDPSYREEIGWLNPPYGREIKKFMRKCCEEIETARYLEDVDGHCKYERTLIVALIPSRTDTKWMHDYVYGDEERGASLIIDIKGRLKFDNPHMEWEKPSSAPFPSRLVFFGEVYPDEIEKLQELELGQLIKPIHL